jgi:hypothetical protein
MERKTTDPNVGYWFHTLDADGRIAYQGQILKANKIDYDVQLYDWLMGEPSDVIKIARSAISDPTKVRLYSSDAEMRAASKAEQRQQEARAKHVA